MFSALLSSYSTSASFLPKGLWMNEADRRGMAATQLGRMKAMRFSPMIAGGGGVAFISPTSDKGRWSTKHQELGVRNLEVLNVVLWWQDHTSVKWSQVPVQLTSEVDGMRGPETVHMEEPCNLLKSAHRCLVGGLQLMPQPDKNGVLIRIWACS